MRSIVIIPTLGRGGLVNRLILHLERQRRLPDEVVVSGVDRLELEQIASARFPITYLFGTTGLCAQRNRALDYALPRSDVITFFDDDFLPADSYLDVTLHALCEHPEWVVTMGHLIHDGARDAGLTFDQGVAMLAAAGSRAPKPLSFAYHPGAYGCNMSLRSPAVGKLRFDERLVLYGWQEDIDFTSQLRRHGSVASLSTLTGVHLGLKAGRVSGLRFGYSQIANPIYLILKGTMPARFACNLMVRNLAANCLRSLKPESYIDRRGRLKGNLLALYHVISGRVEPEFILQL